VLYSVQAMMEDYDKKHPIKPTKDDNGFYHGKNDVLDQQLHSRTFSVFWVGRPISIGCWHEQTQILAVDSRSGILIEL